MDKREDRASPESNLHLDRWSGLAAIGLLAVGLWLRLRYLWTHHLWNDEISALQVAERPLGDALVYASNLPHPPASFFAYRFIDLSFAGQLSIDELKYGVLLWTLAIGLTALWAIRRISWFTVPLVIGLGLICTNPLFAYFGSEARPYSLLVAVAFGLLVTSGLWMENAQSGLDPSARQRLAMTVLLALAVWTHYLGLVLVVSVVASLMVISYRHSKALDKQLVRSTVYAVVITLPLVFFLRDEFATLFSSGSPVDDVPTSGTSLAELAGNLGWAVGAFLLFLVFAYLMSLLRALPRQHDRPTALVVEAGLHCGFVGLMVLLLATVAWWITGVQLINIGATMVPALFLVVGVSALLASRSPVSALVAGAAAVAVSVPLAMIVTDTPDILRSNRVSNVDIMIEAADVVGYRHNGGDGTMLISLDSVVSNRYFARWATDLYPAAMVEPVYVGDFDTALASVIGDAMADPAIHQVVLITRYGYDYRVRPYVPEGVHVTQVGDHAWLMVGAPSDESASRPLQRGQSESVEVSGRRKMKS